MADWKIYMGSKEPHDGIKRLPDPPPWREFPGKVPPVEFQLKEDDPEEDDPHAKRMLARDGIFIADKKVIELVNAALYLRRPLLVSGRPGSGKSTLAYAVARELKLGPVLRWPITTQTKLSDGLYTYDGMGHLQDTARWKDTAPDQPPPEIGNYIRLGPLGAALLPSKKPRVLLIDEIDKSNINLPNDLLHIFEEGECEIEELVRIAQEKSSVDVFSGKNDQMVAIQEGRVRCAAFPFVVLTSNEEREFPPAFKRRCLPLTMPVPTPDQLDEILQAHLGPNILQWVKQIFDYLQEVPGADKEKEIISQLLKEKATSQLLNALYLASRGIDTREQQEIFRAVLEPLMS